MPPYAADDVMITLAPYLTPYYYIPLPRHLLRLLIFSLSNPLL